MRRLYVRAWLLGNSSFDFGVPPPPRLVMVHGPGGAWMGGDVAAVLIETAVLPGCVTGVVRRRVRRWSSSCW
jgi:hypothetical protein